MLNTDAEGRLTLADALVYAEKNCKAEAIVDVATLTGACMVALGTSMCGMFSPNQQLISQLKQAGSKSGGFLFFGSYKETKICEIVKSKFSSKLSINDQQGIRALLPALKPLCSLLSTLLFLPLLFLCSDPPTTQWILRPIKGSCAFSARPIDLHYWLGVWIGKVF